MKIKNPMYAILLISLSVFTTQAQITISGSVKDIEGNPLGITPKTAFLKEVIEERYVSGFGMYMPYNDARRLRKNDQEIAVPFILVLGPNPPYPERMPYATNELNSNSNAPAEDPGIFTKTAVNE